MSAQQHIESLIKFGKELLVLSHWIQGFEFADERNWLSEEEKIKLQQNDAEFKKGLKQFYQQLNELKTKYQNEFRSFCDEQEQKSKDQESLAEGWKALASNEKTKTSEYWIWAMAK